MVIEINKDIERYQETVAMGLSAKQLIFSITSVAAGGGLVLLLYPFLGLTGAAYVAIPVVAPIALGGFYSYNGMSFYEVMGRKFHFLFHNRTLTYISTEGTAAIRSHEQEKTAAAKKGKAGKGHREKNKKRKNKEGKDRRRGRYGFVFRRVQGAEKSERTAL